MQRKMRTLLFGKLRLTDASRKLKKGLKDLKSIAKEMPPLKKVTGPLNAKFFVPDTQKKRNLKNLPLSWFSIMMRQRVRTSGSTCR